MCEELGSARAIVDLRVDHGRGVVLSCVQDAAHAGGIHGPDRHPGDGGGKVLVKQGLFGSGMKWKEPSAAVLSVRCLTYTTECWSQFWARMDRYGFPDAA
jgi:hypothetical protein